MNDKNVGLTIKSKCDYPSQLDPFSEKEKEEWGLKLAKAIESDNFFRNNGGDCRFYSDKKMFAERRLYAKGLQSMAKYKEQLGTNGDLSYLNLSTKPLSIIPKLVDVVVNGMADRDTSINAAAIDPTSLEKKDAFKRQLENDMYGKPIIEKANELLGVNVANTPIEDIADSKEDIDLRMQLEYKQAIEMDQEIAISVVMDENQYSETTEIQLLKDITILGVAWAKNRFVPTKGIMLEYVDPENKIHSYSEDPFFRDTFYDGEFKQVLISDVLIEYPWINDPENVKIKEQLENSATNWASYHSLSQDEKIKGTTNLLYFTYKTTREKAKKIKIKATGTKIVTDAKITSDKNPIKRDDFKIVNLQEEIEFEGVFVLGTDIILKWEVAADMARPKSNKQQVISQYVGVAPNREKGYIDSLVARMIPIEDKLNVIELKADQIIQRITPDGYMIDPDAIAELDFGDGNILKVQNIIDMFFQTGTVFARSYGAGGEYNAAKSPITELRTGDSLNKLTALRNEREGYMNLLRDVIGLNKASDASSPDKDSLVGIQKLAALNSNVATRHILKASNYIKLYLGRASSYRISDLLKFSDLREDFVRKIGPQAVQNIEDLKGMHVHDFAITLTLAPDAEESAKMEDDLTKEIDKGALGTEDKYKILNIKNQKLRVTYLDHLKKKRAKTEEARKAREYKIQADENIRAAQAAEQARQQTLQMELQTKGQLQQMTNDGMLQKVQLQGQIDSQNLSLEYDRKESLQYIINQGQSQKIETQENRKDDRSREEATRNSKMIEQRQKDKSPIDFEAEGEGLDVFKLS